MSLFLQVQGGDVKIKAVHADFSVLAICEMSQDVHEDTSTELHLQLLGTNLHFATLPPLNPPPQLAPLRKEQVRTTSTLCKDELHLLLLLFVSAALSVFLHPPSAFTRNFFYFLRGFFCEGNPSEWDNAA